MKKLKIIPIIAVYSIMFLNSCVEDPCSQSTNSNNSSLAATASCDTYDATDPSQGGGSYTGGVDGVVDADSFLSPWKDEDTAIVIDAYQGNSIDWDKMATDTRTVGVIHRSSIGLRVDTQYKTRKAIAKQRGYLWGAYHLGYRGNVKEQVDLFLDLIDGEQDTLMILDLEDTANSRFMSIEEAVVFMEMVYERTGRIPVVYANHSTTKKLNQLVANNPVMQQAKLWYARFKANVTDFPAGIWNEYFLWQFSSEINCSQTGTCLYNVPGTRYDMDVNVFYGTKEELKSQWNNI